MLPDQFLDSLAGVKGFDREAFERVHRFGEQVTSIRLNPAKPVAELSFAAEPIGWCPYGRYLNKRPSFTLDPLFHAGAYYVQEASSMFLWYVLQQVVGPDTQKKVLDLCAAPGGKSTLLASYFDNGLVVSNEVIKSRASVLVENITKWGSDNMIVTNNDPSHFQSLPDFFDVMVVDAPCSGSGLFRKDPEAVNEWSLNNVQLCCQRQQRILADILPTLKEDGILLYSTCSYSAEEDEDIADWLITEMHMESIELIVPAEWNIIDTVSPKTKSNGYRFYPDKIKGEGFFIAVFRKKQSVSDTHWKQQTLSAVSKQERQILDTFISLPANVSLFKAGDAIRAMPAKWLQDLQVLAKYLYIRKAGIEIGSIKGKDVIPSHELAMSDLSKEFTARSLSIEQALQYLRRKEILLPDSPKGWNLVSFGGLPLGWVKVLPNRVNNYYPAEWRILKE